MRNSVVPNGSALVAAAFALMFASAVRAQDMPCIVSDAPDPPRKIYDCGNGLVLEAEAASQLGLGDVSEGSVDLSGSAALVELPAGSTFQIRTPHAIASVRGTVFVVDVEESRSSVFVIEGRVAVTRPNGSDAVTLGPGEGVDVAAADPLTVRRWGAPRVAALLARFGR
jgi:ferric-dicitrate binding protein FerR (iron transport regulator)